MVGSFQVFDTVAVTTKGGPGNASRVIQLYIYDQASGRATSATPARSRSSCSSSSSSSPCCSSGSCAAASRTWPRKARHDSNTELPHTPPTTCTGDRPAAAASRIGRVCAWTIICPGHLHHPLPVLLDAATALSNGKSLASNPSSLLPADFTWGAFKRVLGLRTVEEAQAEGGSGAAINFWLYLRNSVIVVGVDHGRAGVLLRDGGLRLRPDAVARPGQGLRPVPGRVDGPADLHDAAELPAGQGSSAC